MTDHKEPEEKILEGEVIQAERPTPGQDRITEMNKRKTKPLKVTKKQKRINVTKTMTEMGFDPVTVLIHIAQGNKVALGFKETDKPVSVHERTDAAKTLLSYVAPTLKPVDYVDPEQTVTELPVFIGKRQLLNNPTQVDSVGQDQEEDIEEDLDV